MRKRKEQTEKNKKFTNESLASIDEENKYFEKRRMKLAGRREGGREGRTSGGSRAEEERAFELDRKPARIVFELLLKSP